MRSRFSKLQLLLVAFLVFALPAGSWAAKVIDISKTVHNLSTSAPAWSPYAGEPNVTEICIFCHTPHSGTTEAPLWNRINPAAASFSMYTSSNSLAQADGSQTIRNESLICMSCHDGSIATNAIINDSFNEGLPVEQYLVALSDFPLALTGTIRQADGTVKPGGSPGGWEVGHLEDDHPVSIDMAQTKLTAGWGDEFNDPATVESTTELKFYGTGAEKFVECATCHDPHVDYITAGGEDHTPFLRMPNSNSDMCFACHIK